MKQSLSAALAVALVIGLGIGAPSLPAFAAATPPSFSVDCDSSSTLSSATPIVGLTSHKVIAGVVGDTFTVTNTAAVGAGPCAVIANASVSTAGGAVTIGDGGMGLVFTIVRSGTFTIAPDGGGPVTFVIDACSLQGAGTEADPWLVATPAQFQNVGDKIGTSSCSLSGHFLQTADLYLQDHSNDNVRSTDTSSGVFSGVYDGDHYQILLGGTGSGGWAYDSNGVGTAGGYSARTSLFDTISGTVQRVRVSGQFNTSNPVVGGLANSVSGGAVISEIESTVTIRNNGDTVAIGGIVGFLGTTDTTAHLRIQYSKFHGTIYWDGIAITPGVVGSTPSGVAIGGIAGASLRQGASTNFSEIRDSYSRVTVVYQRTSDLDPFFAGGLVGQVIGPKLRLLRNYAVPSFSSSNTAPTSPGPIYVGGLMGDHAQSEVSSFEAFSNFWVPGPALASGTTNPGPPLDYTASPDLLPVAVSVDSTELQALSTFTTKELSAGTGNPGGPEIPIGTEAANDYRWAITTERSTFVPSTYTSIGDFTTRNLLADPASNRKFYQTLRAGVLTADAHGGYDPISTVSYTTLGNVWEICPGEDYPTLVWEEETCGSGGGSSGAGSDSSGATSNPGGLSSAEYAEFLRSGLTLEQFLEKRLAATGVARQTVVAGLFSGMMLAVLGMGLIIASRRHRITGPK